MAAATAKLASGALPPQRVAALRRAVLRWYGRHHRTLPWRSPPGSGAKPDPYHVLVSEAMLQQTQVATVVSYFERFIEHFPTVHALAAAEEQAVLRLWQGLGYYRRARHLHAAAKRIVEHFDGQVPGDVETLMTLPGVGRYAAGAIASISYDTPAPILDGNVARVLARWFAIDGPIDDTSIRQQLWALSERLVPAGPRARAGDFNQALMELGALICTPRSPHCQRCPVARQCTAHQRGRAHTLPVRSPAKAPRRVTHPVAAIARGQQYLLEQRPENGLWARLWQLPTAEQLDPQDLEQWVRDRFGLAVAPAGEPHAFTHQTTHRTVRFVVQPMRVISGQLKRNTGVWRKLDALDDLPLANPQRRIVKMLTQRNRAEAAQHDGLNRRNGNGHNKGTRRHP